MGAWIEIINDVIKPSFVLSHPTWVRGLKLRDRHDHLPFVHVAPHMGAWIEITLFCVNFTNLLGSHPTWVRGLKYKKVERQLK